MITTLTDCDNVQVYTTRESGPREAVFSTPPFAVGAGQTSIDHFTMTETMSHVYIQLLYTSSIKSLPLLQSLSSHFILPARVTISVYIAASTVHDKCYAEGMHGSTDLWGEVACGSLAAGSTLFFSFALSLLRDRCFRSLLRDRCFRSLLRDRCFRSLLRERCLRSLLRDFRFLSLLRERRRCSLLRDLRCQSLLRLPDLRCRSLLRLRDLRCRSLLRLRDLRCRSLLRLRDLRCRSLLRLRDLRCL